MLALNESYYVPTASVNTSHMLLHLGVGVSIFYILEREVILSALGHIASNIWDRGSDPGCWTQIKA